MENPPTVCADDLPTILGIFKNDPKSRSVNIFSSGWILTQNSINLFIYQPKRRPVVSVDFGVGGGVCIHKLGGALAGKYFVILFGAKSSR